MNLYEPEYLSDFINKSAVLRLEDWYKNSKKPALLYGGVGLGKSILVRLFAKQNALTLYELTPSDDRDKESLTTTLQAVSQTRSIFANKNLLFFDDVDVFFSDDRGGFDLLVKTAKESINPVIFVATNIYSDKKMAILREMCELIEIKSLHSATLSAYFTKVCNDQRIPFDKFALESLIKQNSGDIRSIFLDIDFLSPFGINESSIKLLSGRERKEDVFKTVIGLFKSKTFDEAKIISDNTEIDYDLLFAWIVENYHLFYKNENLKEAYHFASLADLNKSRIYSRQNWTFFRYFISLGIIASTVVPKKDNFSFRISFPQSIKMRAKEQSDFSKNKKVANILSKILRGSNSKIAGELFLYKFFLKNGGFTDFLMHNLNDEDLETIQDFFKIKIIKNKIKESKDVEEEFENKNKLKIKEEIKEDKKQEEEKINPKQKTLF